MGSTTCPCGLSIDESNRILRQLMKENGYVLVTTESEGWGTRTIFVRQGDEEKTFVPYPPGYVTRVKGSLGRCQTNIKQIDGSWMMENDASWVWERCRRNEVFTACRHFNPDVDVGINWAHPMMAELAVLVANCETLFTEEGADDA